MRRAAYAWCVGALSAGLLLAGADPLDLKDRQQLADGLFRRSLFDLAAREYAALAEQPAMDGADGILFRLGECYRRTAHPADALTAYKRLADRFPKSAYVPRAQLQRALILLDAEGASLEEAAASFSKLAQPEMPSEVRAAALYHWGETLERMKRPAEALARYEQVGREFAATDYGMYAGLRTAWLLARTGKAEDRQRAMGLYLDLALKAKDAKVAEEACFFAAQTALAEKRYDESANLFQRLKDQYPQSPRLIESALAAGWACFYAGRYQEGLAFLDVLTGDARQPAGEEALYVKANCLRMLDRRAAAVDVYDRQLAAFPEGSFARQARYEKILALYSDGQYDAVLKAAAQVQDPADALYDNVLWMTAESAVALQRFDVAVQNCRLLVDKCPKSSFVKDALYRLGWLQQKQEAWASASSWFLQVAQRFPKDPLAARALYASGVCLSRLGQSDEALRDWTALLADYPDSETVPETLYQKAMEELRMKNLRAAGATLDERMRRFPDDARKAEVLYWRGSVARQMGDAAEAERLFQVCLAASPSKEFEREATLELGMILQQAGRKGEAAALFQKLIDAPIAEKLGADRLAWLAEFQVEQKQYDAAVRVANTLIGLKADKGWTQTAWTLLGRVYRAKGERDPAIRAFREALATGASTSYGAEAALRLGELLSESGHYDEAATQLGDAATRAAAPELLGLRAHAYLGLARNAERKGDDAAALRYYVSVGVLFDDPELVPDAMDHAARLLDKLGRANEARALREELRARYPQAPQARSEQTGAAVRRPEGRADA